METTEIDTQMAWRVVLAAQTVVPQDVVADSLQVSDGCLVFTADGVVVRAFAKGAWVDVYIDA